MALPLSRVIDRALDRVARAFRDVAGRGAPDAPFRPDLPDEDIPRLKARIDACLSGPGGETAMRARAADLGRAYLGLSAAGRARFLLTLARDYGLSAAAVDHAVARWSEAAADTAARVAAANGLRQALEPPAVRLLAQFVGLPQGVKFVVDLRGELLRLGRREPAVAALADGLRGVLATWFDVGFLDLARIDWNAPASLLEKLVAYEAVHAIRSWRDLKNRLDSDRRCFAFFHPRMPEEPLIFVEVALVDGMAGDVRRLLDPRAPTRDPATADTAIFYSISNCQDGLAGVSFGNFLIKRVAAELQAELPNLKIFATLSPMPGFRVWLDKAIAAESDGLLADAERESLRGYCTADDPSMTRTLLDRPGWHEDIALQAALRPVLTRLAARYLGRETRDGRALDRVAHFHLSNGARVERLNWLGDTSANGLEQSHGLMVNYLYKLDEVEANHEAYAGGAIAASAAVRKLAKG